MMLSSLNLKRTCDQNFTRFLWHGLSISYRKSLVQNFMASFCQIWWSYKVTNCWIQRKWHHTHGCTKHFNPNFLCIFLLVSWRKKISYKVLWWFRQFSTNLWKHKSGAGLDDTCKLKLAHSFEINLLVCVSM